MLRRTLTADKRVPFIMNPFCSSEDMVYMQTLSKLRSNRSAQQMRGLCELMENSRGLEAHVDEINQLLSDLFGADSDLKEKCAEVLKCFVEEYGATRFLDAIAGWMFHVAETKRSRFRVLREGVSFNEISSHLVEKLDFEGKRQVSLTFGHELIKKASENEHPNIIDRVTQKIERMRLVCADLPLFARIVDVHPDPAVFSRFYSKQLRFLIARTTETANLKWDIARKTCAFNQTEFRKDSRVLEYALFTDLFMKCSDIEGIPLGTVQNYHLVHDASTDKDRCTVCFVNVGDLESLSSLHDLRMRSYEVLKSCEYSRVNYLIQRFAAEECVLVEVPEDTQTYFYACRGHVRVPVVKSTFADSTVLMVGLGGTKKIVRAALLATKLDSGDFELEEIVQSLPFSVFTFSAEYFGAMHLSVLAESKSALQCLEIYKKYPDLICKDVVAYFLDRKCFEIVKYLTHEHKDFVASHIPRLGSKDVTYNFDLVPDCFKLDFYFHLYKKACGVEKDGGGESATGRVDIIRAVCDRSKDFYARLLEYIDKDFYAHVFALEGFDADAFYDEACACISKLELPTLKYTDEYFYLNSYFYGEISLEEGNLNTLARLEDAHHSQEPLGMFFTFVLRSILNVPTTLDFYLNKKMVRLNALLGHKRHFVLKRFVDLYNDGHVDRNALLLLKGDLRVELLDSPDASDGEFGMLKGAYRAVKDGRLSAAVLSITNPRIVDLVVRECRDIPLDYILSSNPRLLNQETRCLVSEQLIEAMGSDAGLITRILWWDARLEPKLLEAICTKVSETMFNNYNLVRFDADAVESEIFDILIGPIKSTLSFWRVFLGSAHLVRNINFLFFVERCLQKDAVFRELVDAVQFLQQGRGDLWDLHQENAFVTECVSPSTGLWMASSEFLCTAKLLLFNFPALFRSSIDFRTDIDELLCAESRVVIHGLETRLAKITGGYLIKFVYPRNDIEYKGSITYRNYVPVFETSFQPKSLLTLKISELLRRSYKFMEILSLWKVEVDNKIDGLSECPICYLVSDDLGNFPALKCKTCKSAYHKSCFFAWASKVKKSECAICRQTIRA